MSATEEPHAAEETQQQHKRQQQQKCNFKGVWNEKEGGPEGGKRS